MFTTLVQSKTAYSVFIFLADPPPRKQDDTPFPSEKEYKSLSNQNGKNQLRYQKYLLTRVVMLQQN